MSISRRDALMGATAAVAVAGVPTAVAAQAEDAELIALGRQWIVAYGEWIGTEDVDSTLLKRVRSIDNRIADIPARSHHGALVKLRVAAEFYRLMGDIDDSLETRLTYQAWEALETESFDFKRLMRGLPS
ncbi:MAG: hypothetical protein O7D27_12535 [Alphaproteobacteria bacterium]|nr:hypothetical protein [Alphaproteobacteria bacterium]